MITRHWKTIKGTLENCEKTLSYGTGGAKSLPLYNVTDVSGNAVEKVMLSSCNNTSMYYQCFPASVSNMRLFNYPSTNIVSTNVEITPTTLVLDDGSTGSYTTRTGGVYKFVFGDGTTEPTFNDYCIENPIEEGITVRTVYVLKHEYDETCGNYVAYVTCGGIATADTTITEVGIVKSIWVSYKAQYSGGSDDATCYQNILADRQLLPEPLVLKTGDGFTVTIKVEM